LEFKHWRVYAKGHTAFTAFHASRVRHCKELPGQKRAHYVRKYTVIIMRDVLTRGTN